MTRHGTRPAYRRGCRCLPCRAANAAYAAERRQAVTEGHPAFLVPARPASDHLRALAAAGLGTPQVARLSGVARSRLVAVRAGRAVWLMPQTAHAILAVQDDACASGTLVPARGTWQLVRRLECEGFSRAELARRLGLHTPVLQWNARRVTVSTALRLQRLFLELTAE